MIEVLCAFQRIVRVGDEHCMRAVFAEIFTGIFLFATDDNVAFVVSDKVDCMRVRSMNITVIVEFERSVPFDHQNFGIDRYRNGNYVCEIVFGFFRRQNDFHFTRFYRRENISVQNRFACVVYERDGCRYFVVTDNDKFEIRTVFHGGFFQPEFRKRLLKLDLFGLRSRSQSIGCFRNTRRNINGTGRTQRGKKPVGKIIAIDQARACCIYRIGNVDIIDNDKGDAVVRDVRVQF